MAKTSVINPKRRKKSKRRKNYGSAARESNPRRRRRRKLYGAAAGSRRRRRRKNPTVPSVYRASGYRRRPNPSAGSLVKDAFTGLVTILPAATGGVAMARAATKLAGDMENGEPGWKHALALWLAANLGGQLLSTVTRSQAAGSYAKIAALGFGGDLFLRKRFLKDNKFVKEHLYLDGVDDDSDGDDDGVSGFQTASALGAEFVDTAGNKYVQTAQGWALAGTVGDAQFVQDENGQVYALSGFQQQSALGTGQLNYGLRGIPADPAYGSNGSAVAGESSFGYARR